MSDLGNTYLFKAIDNYPYNLPEAIEALTFALSYDDKNPTALALMGRIYAEQLHDYEASRLYYEKALASKVDAIDVYPNLINTMIWADDFEDAKKAIAFALNIKGIDKGRLWYLKALVFEHKKQYKKALKSLATAQELGFNTDFIDFIERNKKRVKSKMPKVKKKKNKN